MSPVYEAIVRLILPALSNVGYACWSENAQARNNAQGFGRFSVFQR